MAKQVSKPLHLLTALSVKDAAAGDTSDGGGLVLRSNGVTSSWVFRYTSPAGRRREMGLGAVTRGSLKLAGQSLTEARAESAKARALLRDGLDPLDVRDSRRQAAAAAATQRKAEQGKEHWTLARCARDYHERVIEPRRTARHGFEWISSLERHVPNALWHAPIGDVTPPRLLEALRDAEPHERARRHTGLGETLKRCRQRLDAVFEDAMFHGRCTTNPARAIGRKMREERPVKAAESLRALDYRKAPALLARIRAMPRTAARTLEFAVLTAARTAEVLGAEWSEIDGTTWALPGARMKRGEPHTVYLSRRAREIVEGQRGQDARFIFPTTQAGREGKPQSGEAMRAVLRRLGVHELTTPHGLCRATFSTWANETGAARPDVIEACLAHAEADRVRRAYSRGDFATERRALLEAWAEYLHQTAEIIAFPGSAA